MDYLQIFDRGSWKGVLRGLWWCLWIRTRLLEVMSPPFGTLTIHLNEIWIVRPL